MTLPPPLPSPEGMPRGLRWFLGAMAALLATALTVYVVNPFGTASADPRLRVLGHAPFRVASTSMAPTFQRGETIVVSAWSLARTPLALGDVVIFRPPHDPRAPYLARLVGLPGDRVRVEDGRTFVNDVVLDEPFLRGQALVRPESLAMDERTVPEGGIWLLGDNRDNSEDSRYWGAASLDGVVGRVVLTF